MKHKFSDLIDVAKLQRLSDLFSRATGMVTAVLERDGTIITKSGWQDICTKFHRQNPETSRRCFESDTIIANRVRAGQRFNVYRCKNGLIDAASPITIEGEHVATFFTGQFLFEPPNLEFFRKQAYRFGFDEAAYLRAAASIPIIDEATAQGFLDYFSELAGVLGEMGLARLKGIAAQEAVRRSERLLKALVNGTTDAVYIKDSDGRYLLFNDAAARATDKEPENVIGRDDTFLFPAEEAKALMQRDRTVMQGDGPRTYEEIVTTASGEALTYLATKGPLFDTEGNLLGLFGVSRDITKRKRLEEELRISRNELELRVEERTRSLKEINDQLLQEVEQRKRAEKERKRLIAAVEQSAEGISLLDAQGVIEYANKAYFAMTGYTREELIGKNIIVTHSEQLDRSTLRELRACTKAGRTWTGVLPKKRKDGGYFDERVTVNPLKDDSGTITGYVTVASDVTEYIAVRERLDQARKMEAIGTLAGGIAHDFNNMLAVIIGNAELALDTATDGESRENLNQILKASLRSRDLVRQILAFSRKSGGERKAISTGPLLRETCEMLRASIPSTVQMDLNITESDATIVADPSQIQQVVVNLANNAAYAMRENGGRLSIDLSTVSEPNPLHLTAIGRGPHIKLTVKDTGAGMAPEMQKRIFEPFFTTKEPGQGTGMGLAVVHGIVESYGGTIEVASEIGKGSTFTILLPCTDVLLIEETPEESAPLGKEHILFVDDEASLVDVAKTTLERLGYRVTAVTNGMEALMLFTEDPDLFDLVITDQTMPDVTGLQLADEILSVRSDMPLILCTGYSDLVSPEKARDVGISEFVMKPVTKEAMALVIRKVLDRKGNRSAAIASASR